tara:strand:+ start:15847 stop:16671 length:825 start_codon:yes stop_codon:yes gene_type:complete
MSVRQLKPITPGSRFASRSNFDEITRTNPEKSLTLSLRKSGGRNNNGRITMRRRGGGHRRRYRIIDFKRDKFDIPAHVKFIEYDPNRSANIALLFYEDGTKKYIIAPNGIKVGDKLISSETAPLNVGNAMHIGNIATGTFVHNIELIPKNGGQMARSAGAGAQVMAHDEGFTSVKLPSGEIRRIQSNCLATVGEVGNKSHENIISGKAGRSRWLGKRPKVRGVVMNPVDHPHGGGEGKSSGGRHPVSPWGIPTKGYKTRKKNKKSNAFITKRRK